MNWAVIMAGGNGTRFWPLSTSEHPKQFLKLIGDSCPAQSCVSRLARVIPMERILIVASGWHKKALKEALPDFPENQILWEPCGKNTAPCIAWATEFICQKDPQAVIGVFPSDHAIPDENAFASCLKNAYEAAPHRIVLFGIQPTHPETGFGYIEEGEELVNGLKKVASFREKPDLKTALDYIQKGCFLWNSGMFIFDAQIMQRELMRCVPNIATTAKKIVQNPAQIESLFREFVSISIDYAVMEHTDCAAVFRADFAWDDLGSWSSIRKYFKPDADGNILIGNTRIKDCKETFVYSTDERVVATLGVKNIVVVSTPDALLVMDAAQAQNVGLVRG